MPAMLSLNAWCAAFFFSSVLFSHNVALRLVLLALGLVAATAAVVQNRRSLSIVPPIWLPFVLWAAWAAVCVFLSVEPERSEKEFVNEVVYAALAFLVCYIGAQAPRAARIFL